jgi:tellurite methyltransferase
MSERPAERIDRWNERYSARQGLHDLVPSSPLPAAISGVAPGLALDLACGAGRHALYLAQHGWQVVAVDGSQVGIDLLRQEAQRLKLLERITTHVADLESEPPGFVIDAARYDLICDFYYLHRPLFPAIRDGVRPGGRFVAAIHILSSGEAPHMNPAFLLHPGELLSLAHSWGFVPLHTHEGPSQESGHSHGTAELVARRPVPRDETST